MYYLLSYQIIGQPRAVSQVAVVCGNRPNVIYDSRAFLVLYFYLIEFSFSLASAT